VNRAEVAKSSTHHKQAVLFAGSIGDHRMDRSRVPALGGFIGDRFDFVGLPAAVIITLAPARDNPNAIARPRPRPPPVTISVLSRSWPFGIFLSFEG
jgi:hypothetical protein